MWRRKCFIFYLILLVKDKERSNQNYDVNMDLSLIEHSETYPDTIRRPELVASATG